jgi:excisionase family DNA binding protein
MPDDPSHASEDILTVEEVARYLRVHPVTVQRWVRAGTLPAARVGRTYRIKRADLDLWWAANRARTPDGDMGQK